MAEIPLTKGQVALVDDDDLPRVAGLKWHSHKRTQKGFIGWYARTTLSDRRNVYMHRLLMPGMPEVDHINGNGLDNQRSNLRSATRSQNVGNQAKYRGSSQYKGVSWSKRRGKWVAGIGRLGGYLNLGYFHDEASAAEAYNVAALAQWGEYARLNIIERGVA